MNPVNKAASPSKVFNSSLDIEGTQFMIVIPLTENAIDTMPRGTDDFLMLEV